ncbi:hypothetical protein EQ811_11755 [Staphylococcus capitis]|uniref:Uncharacterized protein n=1 Tax=Staphylococcus capitis TaxID=29388 RepID=A0A7Z8E229_STACP|nr:hypothetical protein [Staphylococcus capitis]MDS4004864.1 hypothetical protein [Staphylococcus capitis]TBW75379.1 hypothetical protein EQ811_11755 [Staphylococcus capitis]
MLKNIKENKNFIIPTSLVNDSTSIQKAGVGAWSGWVLVYKSSSVDGNSVLKDNLQSFNLKTVQ